MSKLRIEKLKQGNASNNDVLVFRNDLGTFQGQSNLSVNTITLGTNTVNSSVYTGTANNATYLNGQPASYYADVTGVGTAYSNAVSTAATDATSKAATAYANAVTYTNNLAATAYSNAVSQALSLAAAAYSNAVGQATTLAAAAYTNAVAYAASNTYVNAQDALKANLSGASFTGAVSIGNTLASGNTTITGFANITGTLTVGGQTTIAGNLVVNGTTITVNTSQINVTDSLMYLASNNEVSDSLDIGFAAHYNNGAGANGHTGFVRSATTKKYYLFQNYQPEFFSNNNIDIANTSTGIQMADLVVGNLVANSTLLVTGATTLSSTLAAGNTTITGFANVSIGINTPGTLSANVISVSNVSVTQQNLQVDAAGTATAMAIVFGG